MIKLFTNVNGVPRDSEKKYLGLFKNFNLTKGFYFSYTYNLSITL
jgi:hypothetical protein